MTTFNAQIEELTIAQATRIYNELADSPISKFATKGDAHRRTAALIAESGMKLVRKGDQFDIAPIVDEQPKRRGAPTEHTDDVMIDVNVGQNPKRKGSLSAARFQLILDAKGMTVGEYRDAVRAIQGEKGVRSAMADLRWDHERQFVTVWTKELLAETQS